MPTAEPRALATLQAPFPDLPALPRRRRTVSRDDTLVVRGANPRTGIVSPYVTSSLGSSEERKDYVGSNGNDDSNREEDKTDGEARREWIRTQRIAHGSDALGSWRPGRNGWTRVPSGADGYAEFDKSEKAGGKTQALPVQSSGSKEERANDLDKLKHVARVQKERARLRAASATQALTPPRPDDHVNKDNIVDELTPPDHPLWLNG